MADAVTIKLDFTKFAAKMNKVAAKLKDKEYLLRPVAIELIPLMTRRIHQNGNASDGKAIGTYSKKYMKLRIAGDKEKKIPKLGASTKVIVVLTSNLQNDWSVIATSKGYGIGFKNPDNIKKARWVEATYNKEIFSLSKDEEKFARDRLNELIKDAFINP